MTTMQCFDVGHAVKYGLAQAIIIQHFQRCVEKTKSEKANHFDGRTWSYESPKSVRYFFPYLTPKQFSAAMASLVRRGILVSANYKGNPYRKENGWYAFADERSFVPGK